jgi:hypothetical protein
MKKITLPFLFLIVFGLLASMSVSAQGNRRSSFRVEQPASISGYKIIEEADMVGTSPWGSAIDSAWENIPVGFDQSNPNGCTAFTAGTFTGKFALIYRGSCEFGAKALAAQNAGAIGVIIVNNLLGVAGMGAGASGATVTIPVIMVTRTAGDEMKNQLVANTPVSISLTNWRFDPIENPIDIGFMNDGPILPIGKCLPKHQVNGTSDERFRLWAGARFYNFSVDSFNSIFQKGIWSSRTSLTSGSYSPVDSDEVTWNFSTHITTTDSILTVALDTVNQVVQGFDMNDQAIGSYKMQNIVEIDSTLTEDANSLKNNIWDYEFAICDSIYSKSQYDFVKKRPVVNSYLTFGTVNSEWGPVIEIRNGGYSAKKVELMIMRDNIDDSIYNGQIVEVKLSKWDDADSNGGINPATELTEIANGDYTLGATEIIPIEGQLVSINLNNAVNPGSLIKLDANSKYWLSVKAGGTLTWALGTDYYADYTANLAFGTSEGNPLINDGTMFGGGFANAGSPSIALHMNTNIAESINDVASFAGSVKVYPNPTSNDLFISLNLDNTSSNVTYEIVDVTGRTIATKSAKNIKSNVFTYNTASLTAGTYFVNVITDAGTKQVKFVVAK